MNITDINCFIGYFDGEFQLPEFTPEILLEKMDKYKINHAVVYSKWAKNEHEEGNAIAREFARKYPEKISSCYVLSPNLGSEEMPSAEELYNQLKKERPAAVRLFPKENFYIIDSFYSGEVLDVINELRIPLILEGEENIDFKNLPALTKEYANIPFVLLKMGLRFADYIRPLIVKRKNVYFDTAYNIDTGFMDEMVNRYGSERFIFGSGLPYMEPSGMLGMIFYGDFGNEHKENILSGNWNRLQEAIKWE